MKDAQDEITRFESLLRERSESRWAQYRQLVELVRTTLPYQQDHFDTHAAEHHIRQVLRNAHLLVPDELKEQWSVVEIFLFLCSVWLHDLGKLEEFDSAESYKEIRARHAERSYQFVISINEKLGLDEKEALIIAYVVKGHTLSDLGELPEKKALGVGGAVSVRPLAALLRLADELDMDYRRVPDIVKRLSGIPSTPKWTVRESIDGLEINNSVWDIIVYSTPKSFEALEDVKRALSWANETLDAIRGELRKLRLLYRRIDHVVDDTHLRDVERTSRTKKTSRPTRSSSDVKTAKIVKLCPFTGAVCNTIHETENRMVFVGMPFSEDFVDVYRFAIQPAIENRGFRAWRADEVPSSVPIFCKICAAIHKCGLAVIDISASNPNVMFELGMAAALGKKVVLIKNHKHSVPTDLAGFEYVAYRNAYELKESLQNALPERKKT